GSLRRQAQWLHRYPNHEITDLRGNVQTRLQKLQDNAWDGALFAAAGLQRLSLELPQQTVLEWMIPAPAQGAIAIVISDKVLELGATLKKINHPETETCTQVERDFLRTLEGGCSAPIGALATIKENTLHFKGVLLSPDGQKRLYLSKKAPLSAHKDIGKQYAREVLSQGGDVVMKEIKAQLGK
ncbi:MAG: hydroxymethylbilane synthase, partial [Eudoraea sp.]|nr:hydroxymethylbilane synthase [Eudoraea sp.]